MNAEIREYGVYIAATALRNLRIDAVEDFLRDVKELVKPAQVQVFNADRVGGWKHLYFAAFLALKAMDEGVNVSESLPMEVLIQASAQRQIKKAIEMLGLGRGDVNAAIFLVSEERENLSEALGKLRETYGKALDEELLGINGEKAEELKRLFDITDAQLSAENDAYDPKEALTNLIIERMTIQLFRR